MAMMDDIELPLFALRDQLASAIQLIVQVGRGADGKRRITSICRVGELGEKGDYTVHPHFLRDRNGRLVMVRQIKGEPGAKGKQQSD
jgi:pilus assembly protein CpaF